jgi:hypothetical protein
LRPLQRLDKTALERLSPESERSIGSDFYKQKRLTFLDTRAQRTGRGNDDSAVIGIIFGGYADGELILGETPKTQEEG